MGSPKSPVENPLNSAVVHVQPDGELEAPLMLHDDEEDEHTHHSQRNPWLRAFILGANDGLVSVASLMLGVGGGSEDLQFMRLAALAAWIGGALSMALGEYVSVAGQFDAEMADIQKERDTQDAGPEARAHELDELTMIYVNRGLSQQLSRQVAEELTRVDVIRAHARDELGIDLDVLANPWEAASVSCVAFSAGAAMPLLAGWFISDHYTRIFAVLGVSTFGLLLFGFLGAWLGGARDKLVVGSARVLLGGLVAMGATYGLGSVFKTATDN
mmetsp:Transcript_22167/g.37881  ORF Transcript_22167/g.37881 Transcript_22167/m.37881 type:complete len:272 (+) Transcript_22167:45-860(+)|eukprot:CAMPEP_0119102584 /NCGR_PEP_ID=MMETSP1180-20130426/1286_1 /TAXON_ID=3052 ORGANISM="Chlamydomonas cf sp, Strain CCMP681" /NCGR_SAMPLE_ID=MMETSP1180 /ASSEMBLY_ACC=CAM_ASM_000741 /LENGTH=271 /DNA_ID=CAMNT_0007086901 /DNA_START=45 /DNA_END=860 /DNA_ORIENTATION=+